MLRNLKKVDILLSDQLHTVNDPSLIFHMVSAAAMGAVFLPDCIKTATAVRTGHGGNGKSGRLHDRHIRAYLHVNAVIGFMYFSIGLTEIDPPCAEGQMENTTFQLRLLQADSIGVGHFQNIGKTGALSDFYRCSVKVMRIAIEKMVKNEYIREK